LIACVGLGNPAAFPRFTFGSVELMGGIGMIPLMIGMFADLGDHPLRRRTWSRAADRRPGRSATCSRACGR
jgi:TctA family transporter